MFIVLVITQILRKVFFSTSLITLCSLNYGTSRYGPLWCEPVFIQCKREILVKSSPLFCPFRARSKDLKFSQCLDNHDVTSYNKFGHLSHVDFFKNFINWDGGNKLKSGELTPRQLEKGENTLQCLINGGSK